MVKNRATRTPSKQAKKPAKPVPAALKPAKKHKLLIEFDDTGSWHVKRTGKGVPNDKLLRVLSAAVEFFKAHTGGK